MIRYDRVNTNLDNSNGTGGWGNLEQISLVSTIGPLKMRSSRSAINISQWPLMPTQTNESMTARLCFQPRRISKPMVCEPSRKMVRRVPQGA